MALQVKLRVTHEQPSTDCPRCDSSDTWRWARDRSLFRPLAAAFGRQLMTCRGCNHKFYVTTKLADSPLFRILSKLSGKPIVVTKPKVRVIAGRSQRPVRAAVELPALKVSFGEWERRQAEQPDTGPAARLG